MYERELMTIVLAILRWKHYLSGRKFIIFTDQRSLKYFLEQRQILLEYQKWVSKILSFEFEIKFKAGRGNIVVDALSRKPSAPEIMQLIVSSPKCLDITIIQKEYQMDSYLSRLLQN